MEVPIFLSAGLLTTVTVELLKLLWRKVVGNPDYDFSPLFYDLVLPFFTAVWGIVLGLVGFADPVEFELLALLNWVLAIAASIFIYEQSLKPLKEVHEEAGGLV